MKKHIVFFTVIFILGLSAMANAVSITINTDNLDSETAAMVLEAEKKSKKAKEVPTVDQVEAWVNIGDKVGGAIAATCKQLSVEVNEFVKTPVGMIAVGLIAYKVVGEKLWDVIGGTLAWVVVVMIIGFSFRHFHMREKIVDKSDKDNPQVQYIARYEFKTNDARTTSACIHAIGFALITVVCLVIVF
jgi:hypothetical protein